MRIPSLIAASALAYGLALAAHADPVTWTFYETSCTAPPGAAACPAIDPRNGHQDTLPFLVATLTLPDATSSGSAFWDGGFQTPAVFTGDNFSFLLTGSFSVTPEFIVGSPGHDPGAITQFDIEWVETSDSLSATIFQRSLGFIAGIDTNSPLAPQSGTWVAGLPYFGGCLNALCETTGTWVETSAAVPEPPSVALLFVGWAILWAVRRHRRLG